MEASEARTRVKICGLTDPGDACAAVSAGADALGFVFAAGSPRQVSVASVASMKQSLPPFVACVGLFVDAAADVAREILLESGLDTVQFHGTEPPDYCGAFRGRFRVIKALRVRGVETLGLVAGYRGAVDAILLDAWVPGVHGGTGARFDWDLGARAHEFGIPLILAGGLDPTNVARAIRQVRPFAVDVSSGVERAPGRKDAGKMRRFLDAVAAERGSDVTAS